MSLPIKQPATGRLGERLPNSESDQPDRLGYVRWLKLLAGLGLITMTWTVVLPWLATLPPFAQHIERMDRADIAVDAMFYTDLNWQPPDGAAWRK